MRNKLCLILCLISVMVLSAQSQGADSLGKADDLYQHGEYQKAEQLLTETLKSDPKPALGEEIKVRLLLSQLYLETGKYKEADESSEFFMNIPAEEITKLAADELLSLAEGMWFHATRKGTKEVFHLVNQEILPRAEAASGGDKKNPALYTFWGNCFLEKGDAPAAADCFSQALKINANYVPALLGRLQAGFAKGGPEGVRPLIQKILTLEPNNISALNFSATAYIADEKYEEALKEIDKALAINPNSIALLTTKTSAHYLNNDAKEFEEVKARAEKINPKPALFYYILGNNCARQMLYLEAQPLYEKAVELDPSFWDGYVALGLNGLKCGADAEASARLVLEEAFTRDPFNAIVKNSLKVLDVLHDEYAAFKTDHFTIKLHNSEAEMLKPYISDLLERDYKLFTELYKFEPAQPLLCEIFPSMNDFSVRMTGLAGVDFALGVSFAKTFLAYSPAVQEKTGKRFHWGAVVSHEFMHIITLQLSRFHVPRWFTEGCSVYAEKLVNPAWGRELEMDIYSAYEAGKLQKLSNFVEKKGFDLLHTYLLSSLVIEYIRNTYGMDKIIALLKGFGERKKQDTVFKEVLGKGVKEFDAEFFKYLENDWLKRIKIRKPPKLQEEKALREKLAKNVEDEAALTALARIALAKENYLEAQDYADKAVAVNPKNMEALFTLGDIFFAKQRHEKVIEYYERAIAAGADDFGTHFHLAQAYRETKKIDNAIKEFNAAKRCLPFYTKYKNNPYHSLAQIYKEQGKSDEMLKEMEAYLAIAHEDFTTRIDVAQIYRDKGRWEDLIKLLSDAVYIDPEHLKLHAWLAEGYRTTKDYPKAIQEYQVELFLLGKLEAGAKRDKVISNFYCDLAEIYLETGKVEAAKDAVYWALELHPANERAQELSRKIKEQ